MKKEGKKEIRHNNKILWYGIHIGIINFVIARFTLDLVSSIGKVQGEYVVSLDEALAFIVFMFMCIYLGYLVHEVKLLIYK